MLVYRWPGQITDILFECDETKPNCKKCTTFRVSCNYDPKAPDLQVCFDGTATIENPQKSPRPINQTHLGLTKVPPCLYPAPAIISDNFSTFELDRQSLDRLSRFYFRTVPSIGSPKAVTFFQSKAIELACSVRTHIDQPCIRTNIAFCA